MATKEKNMLIDEGPYKWLIPVIESSYSRIISRAQSKNEETETIEIKGLLNRLKMQKNLRNFLLDQFLRSVDCNQDVVTKFLAMCL